MSIADRVQRLRGWAPVPIPDEGISPVRWFLLDGHRIAVASALLAAIFASLLTVGSIWTFEMQRLLTETATVERLFNTILGGIILLVSIVVSINSVVLSYDITSIGSQRERIRKSMEFRHDLGRVAERKRSPSDPRVFLAIMIRLTDDRASALGDAVADDLDDEVRTEVEEFVASLRGVLDEFDSSMEVADSSPFTVLWLSLEYDYGRFMDDSQHLRALYEDRLSEEAQEQFDDLESALELFATGREYFKTLYYSSEFSQLSRTLLVVSLPAILTTITTVLAISAGLLPDVSLLGLPSLQTFVAATFTVSLAPFVVLTSFVLRSATVARMSLSAGPFVLRE